jgi:hypothetical protein
MVHEPSQRTPGFCAHLPCRVAPFLSSSQVFSRFLAPYVENLDMGLVNLGIVQGESMRFQSCKRCNILRGPGQVTLGKLRIKKAALDAFRLPVDVAEGSFVSLPTRNIH